MSEVINGRNHVLGTKRDDDSGAEKCAHGHQEVQLGVFLVVLFFLFKSGRVLVFRRYLVLLLSTGRPHDVASARKVGNALSDTLAVRPRLAGNLFALHVENVNVGVELEVKVGKVYEKQDNGSTTRELSEVGLRSVCPDAEDGGDNDGGDSKSKKRSGSLCDGRVEVLLSAAKTAKEETEAHDEQQVGEDGADEGGLDNDVIPLDESNNGDNQLDSVTKGGVDETTEGLACAKGDFFRGKTQHSGKRNDGDKVDDEDDGATNAGYIVESDTDGSGKEQDIDPGAEKGALELVGDSKWVAGLGVDGTVECVLVLLGRFVVVFFLWDVGQGAIGFAISQAGGVAIGDDSGGGGWLDGGALVFGDLRQIGVVAGSGRGRTGSLLGRSRSMAKMSALTRGNGAGAATLLDRTGPGGSALLVPDVAEGVPGLIGAGAADGVRRALHVIVVDCHRRTSGSATWKTVCGTDYAVWLFGDGDHGCWV